MNKAIAKESLEKFYSENKILSIIISVIVLILFISSLYFYNQYQKTKQLLQNSNQQVTVNANVLIAQVGKLIQLPVNENPTIATVSDETKLAGETFFANAKNGDKVLIYAQAKKAILYRPSINKIIEVSSVNINQPETAGNNASQSSSLEAPILSPTPALENSTGY